jgi:hypothetical protein
MTHEQQWELADQLEFDRIAEREMKLRRMAVDAATSNLRPIRFAVIAEPRPLFRGNPWDLGSSPYREITVDLYKGLVDHDLRVLVAEEILRPQLREAGWKVKA